MQIVVGLVLLIALMMAARWFTTSSPKTVVRTAKWAGAVLLVAGGGLLVVTGRAGWALAALVGLTPWISRAIRAHGIYRAVRSMLGGGGRARHDGTSTVETRFLSMSLDTQTGILTGRVKDGPFRERPLSGLSFDEALELRRQCAADPQSVQVLEAWLDRTWPDWRDNAQKEPPNGRKAASSEMTREEACEVLGLALGAGPDEIKAAHRRLMNAAHPDHGGSNYLASKINQAKDTLLSD